MPSKIGIFSAKTKKLADQLRRDSGGVNFPVVGRAVLLTAFSPLSRLPMLPEVSVCTWTALPGAGVVDGGAEYDLRVFVEFSAAMAWPGWIEDEVDGIAAARADDGEVLWRDVKVLKPVASTVVAGWSDKPMTAPMVTPPPPLPSAPGHAPGL